jgi:DNA-directed RNA polymerase beta subunit
VVGRFRGIMEARREIGREREARGWLANTLSPVYPLVLQRRYEISFGQIYLSKTTMTESDGTVAAMFPQEARLRNLTYVLLPPPYLP